MSKLDNFEEVLSLFQKSDGDFYIPEYQRPYAWKKDECQTLWEDIKNFAEEHGKDNSEKYFLGPIVMYKNNNGQKEIIDGQQRLTTLMLLMRAFYSKVDDVSAKNMKVDIGKCIYNIDKNRNPEPSRPKLVVSDAVAETDKNDFRYIIEYGLEGNDAAREKQMKSNYAKNYRFFQEKIEELQKKPIGERNLPHEMINAVMDGCVLLAVETEGEEAALRIFSTLNNRGLQLSEADIFKAEIYRHFQDEKDKAKKDTFIKEWKGLEDSAKICFNPKSGTPMTELFMHYMHCVRAKKGESGTTTMALRKFYKMENLFGSKESALEVFDNIKSICEFWKDIAIQESERFSEDVLKKLFVLNYAPNSMWAYIVSVYYLANRGCGKEEAFASFLDKITALTLTYALLEKSVGDLRMPIYSAMVSVMHGKKVDFSGVPEISSLTAEEVVHRFECDFDNRRPATKSFLAWWVFQKEGQKVLELNAEFDIEHIHAKSREDIDKLEWLGNKSLLERKINNVATNYSFPDKAKCYMGTGTLKKRKLDKPTEIAELVELAKDVKGDFGEDNVVKRNSEIANAFVHFLKKNDLLKN